MLQHNLKKRKRESEKTIPNQDPLRKRKNQVLPGVSMIHIRRMERSMSIVLNVTKLEILMNIKELIHHHPICFDIYVRSIHWNLQKKEDETKAAKGANSPNTVLNYMRKLGNWKVGSEKYVAMEKKLVKFVVSTNQPLSVVENEYFQDLLHPDFKAPCRKSFTQRSIVSCYEHTKEAFLFDINTTCTKNIGIQVDHTTAKNLTPFGNMCVQHIKDDFSRIHTEPYQCDHCSKAFSQHDNLTKHMRLHTG